MTIERPCPKRRSGPQARVEKADAQATELAPIIVEIRASGATTLQAIADGLNTRGISTARGDKWGTSSVFPPSRPHRQAQRNRTSTQMTGEASADAETSADHLWLITIQKGVPAKGTV
jgi:hypothetical protein